MKILLTFFMVSFLYIVIVLKWTGVGDRVALKMKNHLMMEKKALVLVRKNRLLLKEISDLQYKASNLKSKIKYYSAQKTEHKRTRKIASIPRSSSNEDFVQYEVYQWTPEKLLAIAEKEFHFKHYEKSTQFYEELISRFPDHKVVTDKVLFGAGVVAFETGKRFELCEKYLGLLIKKYPQSKFKRGAKLWMALSHYNQGEVDKFKNTVEEFRVKYRNTDEWKILSKYYENISEKNNL